MVSQGWKVLGHDTNSNQACYVYVKYFDVIHMMVIADSISQSIYAVRFCNEDEMAAFMAGDFTVVFNEAERSFTGHPCRRKEKIDLLEPMNLRCVTKKKHLVTAMKFFENQYIVSQILTN